MKNEEEEEEKISHFTKIFDNIASTKLSERIFLVHFYYILSLRSFSFRKWWFLIW